MKVKAQSVVLFGVQLVCIVFLLFTGHLLAAPPWIFAELLSFGILGWAVYTMKPQHLNPLPELRPNSRLVVRGPYRWVRHPMYSGVLLGTLALVLDRMTPLRLLIWLVLLIDLIAKLEYEETLLARRFPEYGAYRKRTRRLIPFVY